MKVTRTKSRNHSACGRSRSCPGSSEDPWGLVREEIPFVRPNDVDKVPTMPKLEILSLRVSHGALVVIAVTDR